MSIELVTVNNKAETDLKNDQVIEHSTQEVGVIENLPRVYSSSGRIEDSYVSSFDTYGSYSGKGMYGNHASINYVFGHLGGSNKNSSSQTSQLRYDNKGIILNYTSKVSSMFLLKNQDDLMGENIMNLIDPNYVKSVGEAVILQTFGLAEGVSNEDAIGKTNNLTGVRTNGDIFNLSITLTKIQGTVYTCKLADTSDSKPEDTIGGDRTASSSSFSSYADTFNSHKITFNTASSTFNNSFYGTIGSGFNGVVVDMNEMDTDDEWVGISRYAGGVEEVYGEDHQAHPNAMSAVSLTAFSDLRRGLENGVILVDCVAESISEVINFLLDEAELKNITTPDVREPLLHCFDKPNAVNNVDSTSQREGCKVYVAKLSFLKQPIISLIRLKRPIVIDEKSGISIRYFLFVLGSTTCTSTTELHEMGRAFSLMMSQNWFSNTARKINTAHLFLKLMDNFMTRCMMLPPPDPLAENPYEIVSNMPVEAGCCGARKNKQTVVLMMPNNTLQRTNHQLRKRKRVINEHQNNLLNSALQQEPTVEELEKDKPSPFISRLTLRDKIVGGITGLLCVLITVLLLTHHFVPYDDGLHSVPMTGYSMHINGGFKSIIAGQTNRYILQDSPRGLYEIRTSIEHKEEPYWLQYTLNELLSDESTVQHGEPVILKSDPQKETESLAEFDFMDEVKPAGESRVFVEVTTNSTSPVGYVLFVQPMNPIGRHRILIGSILLVAIYVLLLLEVINRAVVAFIGAFLSLLLVSFISEAPSLDTVVSWMDASTLCLLFGMMIMIQMLSTTGLFEYMAVAMLMMSKGNILILNICLCLLTGVCSAFLDNVTTMLLIAPVTIELSRMMKVDPIPFLLPEVIYSNIGGTATQIGDPPNIIIGNMLKEHLGFIDFIKHCTPCVLICFVVVYPFVYFYYRKELTKPNFAVDTSLREKYPIKNKPLLLKCGFILLTVIILFFLHSLHHIDTAFLAIAGAFACLLLGTNEDLHATFELLEWETLVFFAGLFIMIEGINEIGVIRAIGNAVSSLIEGAPAQWQSLIAHMLILWVSGLASSVLDNIAFTATIIPVIQILASHPELGKRISIYTLAWALSFGACFGGNGTLVGAGANLVTAGISASNGHPVTFGMFFKFGFSCMMITLVISTFYVWIRYVWFVCLKNMSIIYRFIIASLA